MALQAGTIRRALIFWNSNPARRHALALGCLPKSGRTMGEKPETLDELRRQQIIREAQAKIGRELAAMSEVPKTMPRRIADLVRELHRRLREP
jgi:hypothetical protein